MFSNDLNSAYEYERERRNDGRRAAAESLRARGLRAKSAPGFPSALKIAGILALLVSMLRML